MENQFFHADKLSDSVTRIEGLAGEKCYLIEGEHHALLIDGLTGVGSLKEFVASLTDLPVVLAITHGHIDHAGAVYEYGSCYIHPDDVPLMYTPFHSGVERRLQFATKYQSDPTVTIEDVIPPCAVKTYPLHNGDRFDLGGIVLEVIEVVGHTYGSVVFLDRANRVVYSGDACNSYTLLYLDGSASVAEYRAGLVHFKQYQSDFDVMYGGHDPRPIPASIIDDAIAVCDRILAREDDAIPVDGYLDEQYLALQQKDGYLPIAGGQSNIVYRKDRITQSPRTKELSLSI